MARHCPWDIHFHLGFALPAHSIPSPEQLPKRLVISRWQIQSWPERSKSSIICSQRGGLWKIPQLGFSRLAEWWADCRSPRSVTACIQTEYATDTENPLVCGGSFQHSFLGPCARREPCEFSRDTGKHPCCAQRFSHSRLGDQRFSLNDLYSMPQALTDDIAEAAAKLV